MSAETAQILSAQEQAIESGKKVVHGTVTERVLRMYEAIRGYGPPRVTLSRAMRPDALRRVKVVCWPTFRERIE